MKKILDLISEEMQQAFAAAGYDAELGRVTVSNRPDLVNTSATAPWQAPRSTTKRRL